MASIGSVGRTALSFLAGHGALAFGAGLSAYTSYREGYDLPTSLVKGAFEVALWSVAPGPMFAVTLGPMAARLAVEGGYQYFERRRQFWRSIHRPYFRPYVDTRQAATMRQAAIQAIAGSKMNARSALGQEASLFAGAYQPRRMSSGSFAFGNF